MYSRLMPPKKEKKKEDLEKRVKELEKKMECIEKGGTKTKKKREGPPRPPSEYNKFFKENHIVIKREHPDWTAKQIFKEVAKLWKEKKNQQDDRNDSD